MYKFIDSNTIERYRGGFVVLDGKIYTNPSAEILGAVGYKELTEGTNPEYDPATQYLKPTYTDGDVITVNYTIVNKETAESGAEEE